MEKKNKLLIKNKKKIRKKINKIKLISKYFFSWLYIKYLNIFFYIKQKKIFKIIFFNPILLLNFIIIILLIVIPLLIILLYSFIQPTGNSLLFEINLKNFIIFFSEKKFIIALFLALGYSLISSLIGIIIAYPIAYFMAFCKSKLLSKNILILVILPIWINILLKIIGLQTLFNIVSPYLLGTPISIIIGMVYAFLPFVILTIYNSLYKINISLIEASKDLGANGFKTFWKIIFRKSIPGIISGGTLLLIQSATSLIIVKFMGNGQINLIVDVIESYFFGDNFGIGASISIILAIVIFLIILISNSLSKYFEIRKEHNNDKFF